MKNLVKQIISNHLKMRMLDIPDAADLQQLLAKNREYMLPWIPWAVDEPETVEIKKEEIRTWKGEFYLDQKYVYGIFNKSKDRLIGLSFLFTRQGKGILEIGYMIDQDESGKGYATESTYALAKLGFEYLAIDKMEIHCSPKNEASANIPKKLGFQMQGIYKSIEKDKHGKRSECMRWVMFIEEFELYENYEPVTFQLEE